MRLYWTTADGRQLYPEQMSSGHIVSTLNFCVRRVQAMMQEQSLAALAYANSAPYGAAMAAESEADALLEASHNSVALREQSFYLWPVTRDLENEFAKRHFSFQIRSQSGRGTPE